jgi:hypothetical protein
VLEIVQGGELPPPERLSVPPLTEAVSPTLICPSPTPRWCRCSGEGLRDGEGLTGVRWCRRWSGCGALDGEVPSITSTVAASSRLTLPWTRKTLLPTGWMLACLKILPPLSAP